MPVQPETNRRGVYFLVDVTDNKLETRATASPVARQGDSEELFFDGRDPKQLDLFFPAITSGAEHVKIIPNLGATAGPCGMVFKSSPVSTIQITAMGKKTDKGYLVEGFISGGRGCGLKFVPEEKLGFEISVNDRDDGKPKSCLSMNGEKGNSTSAANWSRYKLSAEKQ